jgi:hypothetical protein
MPRKTLKEIETAVVHKIEREVETVIADIESLLSTGQRDRAKRRLFEALFDQGVTEDEASVFLGVAVRTLQEHRQLGTGPEYFKVGTKSVRYTREALRRYRAHATRRCTANVPGGPHLTENAERTGL